MARLLSWPVGLRANFREPLSGPRTIGAGETESIRGWVQTSAAPFGLWRWRFQFPPLRGQAFTRYEGWITGLHGGANATRVPFCPWDNLSFAERGIVTTHAQWKAGQPWDNGLAWSNGKNWQSASPVVPVAQPAAVGDTEIYLGSAFWGNKLGIGNRIGFFPSHYGMYIVTKRFAPGHYRIWPPLDVALTTSSRATLKPTMAMRLESEDAANAPRGPVFADGLSVTLLQVKDADVRTWFTD